MTTWDTIGITLFSSLLMVLGLLVLAVFLRTKLFLKLLVLLPWKKSCSSLFIYSTRVISNLKQMPWTCEPYWFKLEQGLDGMVLVDFIVIQRVNDFGTAILILLRPTKLISLINIDILIWIFDLFIFLLNPTTTKGV